MVSSLGDCVMFTIDNLNNKVMQNLKHNALRSLLGNNGGYIIDGEENITFDEGTESFTAEQIQAEMDRLQALWDANEYARNRAAAYPSLKDQMDMQFHDAANGTTTWNDAIVAVKSAHPKPSE